MVIKNHNFDEPSTKNFKFKDPISLKFNPFKIIFNILILLSKTSLLVSSHFSKTPPPLPILPIPTSSQLSWQQSEMALFLHFGPNTFTDSEWGTGHVDPLVFNPTSLNATQWVSVAKDAGFSRVILTAKHHDGFCLWPSEYTDYSVKSSSWKNGKGDVVGELAEAARINGLQLGLYLSPWDRHEPCYGKTLDYNEHYLGQMTELLTRYGTINEVWLDGAKGEGEKDMEYFFDDWFSLIHQLQPTAVIFSDVGPDTRWVGDEDGVAGATCWSLFNQSDAKIGATELAYSSQGDPFGRDWVPAECDVSIRPGWFWHESQVPKTARTLLDLYYHSVGRNCLLLLNVPPNSSGLISDEDIRVLQEFNELRSHIFSHNLAQHGSLSASSTRGGLIVSPYLPENVFKEGIFTYWAPGEQEQESSWALYLDFEELVTFNVLQVQEPIHMGQRIMEFHLDTLNEKGKWQKVVTGTTVGYRRLLLFPRIESRHVRLVIDKARATPLIAYLGLYFDSFSKEGQFQNKTWKSLLNSNPVLQQINTLVASI